ncbi:MAG: heterodisulfide reductase-related iron-sulfur binding cluster [Candidatus Dormibacteraeota bacterium]|nr:heterodisulfide reductase-related iron-sulfur binding cluster [Candidatus Dormibacteraeota bacterium]
MDPIALGALEAALLIAGVLFWRRADELYGLIRMGQPVARFDDVPGRVKAEAVVVVGQSKLLQVLVPGLMHAAIFWGFMVLLPTIAIAMIGAVDPHSTLPWLGAQGWYALMVDIFAVLVLAGVITAFVIRKWQRPGRFVGSHRGEADLILGLIAAIVVTLLLWHASQIALGLNDYPASWAPVSGLLAGALHRGWTPALERAAVWAHILIILGFLVYLPYSKHLHIFLAAVNVFFGRTRSRGRLEPILFEKQSAGPILVAAPAHEGMAEEDVRFGTATVKDMTWKQVVDTMSCTECGRCQDVCPAYATGKALSPKLLIMALRDQVLAEGPKVLEARDRGETYNPPPLVPSAVTDDVVWDCVTCGACQRECPVGIEHIDHIVDLRRNLVMVESRFPAEAAPMLRDVDRASNPWGKPQADRAQWADGLGVHVLQPGEEPPDILFWVGCAPAFDERARQAAISTAKLMKAARVDFAILGPRESCTGDPARRMGDEYTFQRLAKQNVGTLSSSGVKRIVTTCPHCFNTLSNEYPEFGGSYEVVHHTQFLAELVRDGRLSPLAGDQAITYHDSCYLARHNDVLAQPRELLAAVGRPVEMTRSGKRTFCCGAGGARMWMEESRGKPINQERVREAAATGAKTLAVACPFCTVMLDDGVRETGAKMQVVDLATLLSEAVERRKSWDSRNVPDPT